MLVEKLETMADFCKQLRDAKRIHDFERLRGFAAKYMRDFIKTLKEHLDSEEVIVIPTFGQLFTVKEQKVRLSCELMGRC